MVENRNQDMLKAGTGFMVPVNEDILQLEKQGYSENLIPRFDHLECDSGSIKLYPDEFAVDEIIRFENSSDPDDQSIVYAISSAKGGVKGIYTESYGAYHDELSDEMLQHFKEEVLRHNKLLLGHKD